LAWNLGFHGLLYLYGLKSIMVKKIGWFLFFAVVASSCLDEPECFSLNNSTVGISFRKLSDRAADTVFFSRITAEGAEGPDNIFFPDGVYAPAFDLPLNYYQNQTIYHFEGLGVNYDLQFDYNAQAQFVSEDCGERFVLTDLAVTSGSFDSLRLLARTPKKERQVGTHLEIYRCPNMYRVKINMVLSENDTLASIQTQYPSASFADGNTVIIPLDVASDQSAIRFVFKDGATRDLVLSYARKDSTLFDICGSQIVLSKLDTVSTTFSSAKILNRTFRDPLFTNLEITF
jgi:hypothetical protein